MTLSAAYYRSLHLVGAVVTAIVRPFAKTSHPTELRDSDPRTQELDDGVRVPIDRLPDSSAAGGVPLRILLSDRSGPGAVLRDTLLSRPSSHRL